MKRLNPKTNKPFVRGDIREDGYIFMGYRENQPMLKTGYFSELWNSKKTVELTKERDAIKHKFRLEFDEDYIKQRKKYRDEAMSTKAGHVKKICDGTKHRAKEKQIPFDLDPEYLLSIASNVCPVFGIKLAWTERKGKSDKTNCPSLDKIVPELGYIKGNVQWISFKANAMKYDASFSELHQFADWVKTNIPN